MTRNDALGAHKCPSLLDGAGKSTLINALVGANLVPANNVPGESGSHAVLAAAPMRRPPVLAVWLAAWRSAPARPLAHTQAAHCNATAPRNPPQRPPASALSSTRRTWTPPRPRCATAARAPCPPPRAPPPAHHLSTHSMLARSSRTPSTSRSRASRGRLGLKAPPWR